MDLVIDANILFAICVTKGKTEEIFFSNDIHLFAPEFLFEEFQKYKEFILEKTKRDKQDFDKFIEILKKNIEIIQNEETDFLIEKARKISPDKNDADYFALALKLNCPIWTNDKKLSEQKIVKICTTKDLLEKLNL